MDPNLPGVLDTLSSSGVIVVGGDAAVNDSTTAEIEDAGYEVTRLAGDSRYSTAAAIADLLPPEAVGEFGDHGKTAIIVNGESFADALAAGPMSFAQGWPIFLTTPDRLQGDTGGALQRLGIEHAIIVGGTGAVSEGVVGDLFQLQISNERIAGADRTITSQAVANFMFDELGYGADDMILARGDTYPDALSAGPRAGNELMPILLTPGPNDLGAAASAFIQQHADVLTRIEVFGGTGAVSQSVMDAAQTMARG
jgi:putative cell wall-binding protein